VDPIHSHEIEPARRMVTTRLHRRVYTLIVGLALWLIASVWLFAGSGETDYLLVIVSGFIFVAVTLTLILSRVGTGDESTKRGAKEQRYQDWARSDFDTWQSRLTGSEAAIQILMPIAAVAFGMTLFGIAVHIAEHHA